MVDVSCVFLFVINLNSHIERFSFDFYTSDPSA